MGKLGYYNGCWCPGSLCHQEFLQLNLQHMIFFINITGCSHHKRPGPHFNISNKTSDCKSWTYSYRFKIRQVPTAETAAKFHNDWKNLNIDLKPLSQHLTTHLLSTERADWPKLHNMFKAHDANVWQREFPVGFPVEVSALNSLFINIFHDVVARIESKCVIKAKHVLLVS